MEDMMEMMSMMKDMCAKMNAVMKHLGVKSMSKDEYMNMSDEEKDIHDEKQMKGKMSGM